MPYRRSWRIYKFWSRCTFQSFYGNVTVCDLQAPKEVMELMQPLTRGVFTPQAAQELLKAMGVWAPHEHLAPLRAGLTNDFGSYLRVMSFPVDSPA